MVIRKRLTDWPIALRRWAQSVVGQSYVWGKTDCGSIGRSAIIAMFGVDVMANVGWPSTVAALRVLAQYGSMGTILTQLGATKRPAAFAQSGDIVIEATPDAPGGESLCVVIDGQGAVYSTHDNGVMWGPIPATGDAYSLWQVTDG